MVSHQELAFLTSLACGETNHFQIQISLDGEIFKLQQFVFVMIAQHKISQKDKNISKTVEHNKSVDFTVTMKSTERCYDTVSIQSCR